MTAFVSCIDIQANADQVWDVMSDIDRWHEWTPSISGIEWLHGDALGPGRRVLIRQPGFPPARWQVTEFDPGRGFTWVSSGPGFHVTARHAIAPSGNASRVVLTLDMRGPVGHLLGWLSRRTTQRYLAWESAGLKARCEAPGYRHRMAGSAVTGDT